MKKKLIISIIIVAIFVGGLITWKELLAPATSNDQKFVATAKYNCENSKYINATYYNGPEIKVNPGEMPKPNGSVKVSLDGGEIQTLNQTISGSGVRYSNSDESFVFWNKGDTALIMRNNEMDLTYTNCVAQN